MEDYHPGQLGVGVWGLLWTSFYFFPQIIVLISETRGVGVGYSHITCLALCAATAGYRANYGISLQVYCFISYNAMLKCQGYYRHLNTELRNVNVNIDGFKGY